MGLGRVLAPLVRGLAHGVTLALVVHGVLGLAHGILGLAHGVLGLAHGVLGLARLANGRGRAQRGYALWLASGLGTVLDLHGWSYLDSVNLHLRVVLGLARGHTGQRMVLVLSLWKGGESWT